MNTLQVWANTTMAFSQTFMGMIASLFTAVLAINVFKDTNDDGTELIIISKPISRFKIVMTKFLLFGLFCLMINITAVIMAAFTAFLPRTEPQYYVGLLVSMFIGNLVTFAVFGSLSILLTVKFVKVGVIVTNILISLVFMIYQTLTLFVFSTPAKVLDDYHIGATTYIIADRNTDTGEYKEKEVVRFTPSSTEPDDDHLCDATTWREMKDFWDIDIMGKDISPVLNFTDLAGQLGLTYMSYKTHEFSHRQAQRMFAISRFYKYDLTSPASPEYTEAEEIDDRQTMNWLYYSSRDYSFDIGEGVTIPITFPGSVGFAGIAPFDENKLRGYADKIPIASIRSKELLSANEVFFEAEDWTKYKAGFDRMYDDIFNDYVSHIGEGPDQYHVPTEWLEGDEAITHFCEYPTLFAHDTNNLKVYYKYVWNWLTSHVENPFDFDIHNVNDLNTRFMQFKHYVFFKLIEEQRQALQTVQDVYETEAKAAAKGFLYDNFYLQSMGVELDDGSWMMSDTPAEIQLLDSNTRAPAFIWINYSEIGEERILHDAAPANQFSALSNCTKAKFNKINAIYRNVVDEDEDYLYSSLDTPTRSPKYSGHTNMVNFDWVPGIVSRTSPLPIGHNMSFFFYETSPTINYWIFAVIWGVIATMMFAGGVVVYNKYDIK